MKTGFKDITGIEIEVGDYVRLGEEPFEHNRYGSVMTADDSMGLLPNGWYFDITNVYEVVYDAVREGFTLRVPDVEPDSPYNCKFLNHARSLMVGGDSKIVSYIGDDRK